MDGEHIKCIALIKIALWCATFVGFALYTNENFSYIFTIGEFLMLTRYKVETPF